MEQFSLEKYLENTQRKVVTRLKKSVQIISIDGKEDIPIVALVEGIAHQYKPNGYHADVVLAYSNQCRDMGDYDLFFADDDELTEFEKAIYQHICIIVTACDGNVYGDKELKPIVKGIAENLLDLARKEIRKEEQEKLGTLEMPIDPLNPHYQKGREDAVKSLPKWKKAAEYKDFGIDGVCILDDDIYPTIVTNVNIGEYYIELDELKNLPIEK